MRFWGRLLGRIAILLVLVPSAFAYEAPQLIIVSLAVAWSAGSLSLHRYRSHILGDVNHESLGMRSMERRLSAVERGQEQELVELEDRYHDRLVDMEERLDFTERLLANQDQAEPERYQTPV